MKIGKQIGPEIGFSPDLPFLGYFFPIFIIWDLRRDLLVFLFSFWDLFRDPFVFLVWTEGPKPIFSSRPPGSRNPSAAWSLPHEAFCTRHQKSVWNPFPSSRKSRFVRPAVLLKPSSGQKTLEKQGDERFFVNPL